MPLLSNVYCSIAEVERFFSSAGVTAFSDHDEDGVRDDDVIEDCINEATEELDFYLRQRYTPDVLVTSTLVNRWCVVMATRFLCQRRGNPVPDTIERDYEALTDKTDGKLILVMNGRRQLPGKALREDLRPTMSNLTIDRRYQRSTVRVTKTNSSDPPTKLTQDSKVELPQILD